MNDQTPFPRSLPSHSSPGNSALNQSALQSLIDALPISVLVVKPDGLIAFGNAKIHELLGYPFGYLLNQPIERLIPDRFHQTHEEMVQRYQHRPSNRPMGSGRTLPALRRDGSEVAVQIGLSPIDVDGQHMTVVSLIEGDNQVLKVGSHYDPLTGLPNRTLFFELANNMKRLAARNRCGLGLLFMDLDKFKPINDRYGHDVGDRLLCKVASVSSAYLRSNDVISRLGGDEFVIAMYGVHQLSDLERFAAGLHEQIRTISQVGGKQISISASIGGVWVTPETSLSLPTLISQADKLMYRAKSNEQPKVVIHAVRS